MQWQGLTRQASWRKVALPAPGVLQSQCTAVSERSCRAVEHPGCPPPPAKLFCITSPGTSVLNSSCGAFPRYLPRSLCQDLLAAGGRKPWRCSFPLWLNTQDFPHQALLVALPFSVAFIKRQDPYVHVSFSNEKTEMTPYLFPSTWPSTSVATLGEKANREDLALSSV